MKRILKFISRSALTLLSLSILLCLLLLISAQGFIVWLNTKSGGEWLSHKIETVTADSPYRFELERLRLSGLLGIHAGQISVFDPEGEIANLNEARLRLSPFPLALQKVSLKAKVERLNILKKPLSAEKEEEPETKEPLNIDIPESYFKTFGVKVVINHLHVAQQVAENGFDGKIELDQIISLKDKNLNNSGRLEITSLEEDNDIFYLPFIAENELVFDTTENVLNLRNLSLTIQDNHAEASGRYALNDQEFMLSSSGEWVEVNLIDPDITQPVTYTLKGEGQIETFAADLSLSSSYQNIPANISLNIKRDSNLIQFSDLIADAKDIDIKGAGNFNLETKLADAKLNGTLQSFNVLNALTNQTLEGNGTFSLMATPNNDQQAVTLDAVFQNLLYRDISASRITINGNLTDVRDPKKYDALISVTDARVPQTTIKKADVKIVPSADKTNIKLSAEAFAKQPFKLNGEANLYGTDSLHFDIPSFLLKTGQGELKLSGSLKNNQPDFKLSSSNLDIATLPYVDLSTLPIEINTLSGQLSGTMAEPVINLDYALQSSLQDAPNVTLSGNATYQKNAAQTAFQGKGQGIQTLNANMSMPMALSLQPFNLDFSTDNQLDGNLKGDFDLNALAAFFLQEGYDLRGDMNMNAQVSGPLKQPNLNGSLSLSDGFFLDEINDFELQNMQAHATFSGQRITLSSFTAEDKGGNGNLNASGLIDLSDISRPDITLDLLANNMHVMQTNEFDVRLNANIDARTNNGNYLLSGTISPQQIQINIPERFNNPIPTLNVVDRTAEQKREKPLLEKVKMNMVFDANNQIFVRGWGLDAELAGKLDITGTAANPLVNGRLQTIRGRYEELGKRFEIDRAILRFQGRIPPSPYLDVKTSTELEDDITAHIVITGRATDPNLQFTSTPQLPEDEVLSRILFGQDPTNISAFQAVQLAQTLRRFSGKGGGGFDLLGKVRDVTGLDDIRVEGIGTENATVGAGKYISDRVYLEVEQGTGENSGAASVEIELTPKVTLESKTSQSGDSDVGVFWEWDY